MFQHTLYCLLESLVFAASVPFSVLTLVLASWDSWVDICWQLGGWINSIGKGHQLEFQLMIHHSFLFFFHILWICCPSLQSCHPNVLFVYSWSRIGKPNRGRHPTSMGCLWIRRTAVASSSSNDCSICCPMPAPSHLTIKRTIASIAWLHALCLIRICRVFLLQYTSVCI